jgi:hypothetical protein
MMYNLHKMLNRLDIPWVDVVWSNYYSDGTLRSEKNVGLFWWKVVLKNIYTFKELAQGNIRDNHTTTL